MTFMTISIKPEKLSDMLNPSVPLVKKFMESNKKYAIFYGPTGVGKTLSVKLSAREYGYEYIYLMKFDDKKSYNSSTIFGNYVLYHCTDIKVFEKMLSVDIGKNKCVFETGRRIKRKGVFMVPFQKLSNDVIGMLAVLYNVDDFNKIQNAHGSIRKMLNMDIHVLNEKYKRYTDVLGLISKWRVPEFVNDMNLDAIFYLKDYWNEVINHGDILRRSN